MAVFSEMIVTNNGKTQYAKAIAGKTIEFTRAFLGNSAPTTGEGLEARDSLVNPLGEGAITKIEVKRGTNGVDRAVITVEVNNAEFVEPFEIKELGLFCKDPDTGAEVMYAYCYATEGMDVIPPVTNGYVTWKANLELYISNATGNNTNQVITSWSVALQEHLDYAEETYAKKTEVTTTHISTSAPTSTDGKDGDIWYVYSA